MKSFCCALCGNLIPWDDFGMSPAPDLTFCARCYSVIPGHPQADAGWKALVRWCYSPGNDRLNCERVLAALDNLNHLAKKHGP